MSETLYLYRDNHFGNYIYISDEYVDDEFYCETCGYINDFEGEFKNTDELINLLKYTYNAKEELTTEEYKDAESEAIKLIEEFYNNKEGE